MYLGRDLFPALVNPALKALTSSNCAWVYPNARPPVEGIFADVERFSVSAGSFAVDSAISEAQSSVDAGSTVCVWVVASSSEDASMDVPFGVSAGQSVDSAGSDDAGEDSGLSAIVTWSALLVPKDSFA